MTLAEQRQALIMYLKTQLEREDWHGVSDAANDLRVIEAQMEAKHTPAFLARVLRGEDK